jgi:predicted nucleic acid-binding protein
MVDDPQRIYWDACVLLSYINGIADRITVLDELLRQARAGQFELVTSALSQAEVAFANIEKEQGKLDPGVEGEIEDLWRPGSPIKTVEFYELIGHEARTFMRQGIAQSWGSLKSNDAMHLATAQRMQVAEMHTYDSRLLRWDGHVAFPIREPAVAQMPLISEGGSSS